MHFSSASNSPSLDRRMAAPPAASSNQQQSTFGSIRSWVCPSDRQLMLRAMLGAGWSNRCRDPMTTPLKTALPPQENPFHSTGTDSPIREAISEDEKRHIADILRKAEHSKRLEQSRIENLQSRVQALKVQTRGDGASSCLLCGDTLGFFRRSAKCDICGNRFCDKCSAINQSRTGAQITLCRVCHEQREFWKRSGAWLNGDLPEMKEPPPRSVSILSNSSSTKGGVVDPNAIGGTGWRRYRSIHGQTTVVKPGRRAVLCDNAESDSEGEEEIDTTMLGAIPITAPHTEHLPRKFPVNIDSKSIGENASSTAPCSPPHSRHGGLYDHLSSQTEAASKLVSYAVSRINHSWHTARESATPPQSPPPESGKEHGVIELNPIMSTQHVDNRPGPGREGTRVPNNNPFSKYSQHLATSSKEGMHQDPRGSGLLHNSNNSTDPFSPSSPNDKGTFSPVTSTGHSAFGSGNLRADDCYNEDAHSISSSAVVNNLKLGTRGDLFTSNSDKLSVRSLKLGDTDDSSNVKNKFSDSSSMHSLNVGSASPSAVRPAKLSTTGSAQFPLSKNSSSPDEHDSSPADVAPDSLDRRRLSVEIGRLLKADDDDEPKKSSTSSSHIALVIAASAASGFLTPHTASPSVLGNQPIENTVTPGKASVSDISSPTSSVSSFSAVSHLQKRSQSRTTGVDISDDSDTSYQLPNGGPSIAITEPGNAPDGTLHFTLMYDTAASTLICRIISAKDLSSKDMNGLSDPYVKVELLPDPCKSSQVKTSVVKKCLNPAWDETIAYEGVLDEDMKAKTLRLQVLDKDPIGYDFIGEARTTLSCLPTDRLLSYNVVLKPAQKEPKLLSGAALLDVGRIRLTFLYNSADSVFCVSGLRLARLARAGKKSTKDPPSPIIMIRLVQQNQSAPPASRSFQTSAQKRCISCTFGNSESFKEKITLKELAKRNVDVSVWDGQVNKTDCLIGSVQFGITSHGHQLRHFYQAVKTTDIAHTRWHALLPPQNLSGAGSSSTNASPRSSTTSTTPIPGRRH